MKFLICGVGSIGERHIRNLLSLGYDDIILYRSRNQPLRTIDREFPVYMELEEALSQRPDVALICNPTHLHMEIAIRCAESHCHLFIEKPVSDSLEYQKKLERLLDKNNKIAMVGYMMRYHPCILKIREWINEGKVGRVVSARAIWGEYLPDWHPWEDYRTTYAAISEMGGGPALTLSHELDLTLWMFGKVKKVIGLSNFNSNLEINTEHGIDILIGFENGVTANIHLDYIQTPPKRCTEIVGIEGRIEFDYYMDKAVLYTRDKPAGEEFNVNGNFDRNDMFISELKDFIEAVKLNKPSLIPLEDAFRSVDVALKALSN
jgi:predicted dehydrogenase